MSAQQPLILSIPTTGPQSLRFPDGTAYDPLVTAGEELPLDLISDPDSLLLEQGQAGPPTAVKPDGSADSFVDEVLTPYSNVMPPGVIVVG